jgi:hypothetical protein
MMPHLSKKKKNNDADEQSSRGSGAGQGLHHLDGKTCYFEILAFFLKKKKKKKVYWSPQWPSWFCDNLGLV